MAMRHLTAGAKLPIQVLWLHVAVSLITSLKSRFRLKPLYNIYCFSKKKIKELYTSVHILDINRRLTCLRKSETHISLRTSRGSSELTQSLVLSILWRWRVQSPQTAAKAFYLRTFLSNFLVHKKGCVNAAVVCPLVQRVEFLKCRK